MEFISLRSDPDPNPVQTGSKASEERSIRGILELQEV